VKLTEGRKEYPTYNKRKNADWIGYILRMNCLQKNVIEGKKGREDEEENVISYWTTLRKGDDT